jgi:hypothetical protein
LATKLLETRLGKPSAIPSPGVVKEQELIVNHSKAIVSAPEIVKRPKDLKD